MKQCKNCVYWKRKTEVIEHGELIPGKSYGTCLASPQFPAASYAISTGYKRDIIGDDGHSCALFEKEA